MAVKTFTTGEVLTASDTNTYLNNGGLVYITATTFAGAATGYTTSNVFTSTYENYRIVISNAFSSAGYENLRFRFTTSGTTSDVNYYYGTTYVTWAGATGINNLNGGTSYGLAMNITTTVTRSNCVIDIYRPQTTSESAWSVLAQGSDASWAGNGIHDVDASYDGIRFYLPTGNLNGTARFYGYRQA